MITLLGMRSGIVAAGGMRPDLDARGHGFRARRCAAPRNDEGAGGAPAAARKYPGLEPIATVADLSGVG